VSRHARQRLRFRKDVKPHSEANEALIKSNGRNWTNAASRFTAFDWRSGIAFGGGRFFVFGFDNDHAPLIKTSGDGTGWNNVTGVFGGDGRTFVIADEWDENWTQGTIVVFVKE